MITNSPKDLKQQRDNWIKIFDTFVDSIESYEDVDVGIEIMADSFEELFPIYITIKYKQFNFSIGESFESFVRADEYIHSSYHTYNNTARDLLNKNERLTLENEALKSSMESKKRVM